MFVFDFQCCKKPSLLFFIVSSDFPCCKGPQYSEMSDMFRYVISGATIANLVVTLAFGFNMIFHFIEGVTTAFFLLMLLNVLRYI